MDYLAWCEQVKKLPLDLKGDFLKSANEVKAVYYGDEQLLLKIIRGDTGYISRLKILGEVAYSLFDWHLNPGERVTPNVCPVSPNTLWRQFIAGMPGEEWRGDLYAKERTLEGADLAIVNCILDSRFAQRIALLDFIFLCQDRSARNWIKSGERFWAVDNGIFWPYLGRHADKEVIETGKVSHLNPPIEAIVSSFPEFAFRIGIFSSLFAGHRINDGLLAWLSQVNWPDYLYDLAIIIDALNYPSAIVNDWRFDNVRLRTDWLLSKRRFPTSREVSSEEWGQLIDKPPNTDDVWERKWEKGKWGTKYSGKR